MKKTPPGPAGLTCRAFVVLAAVLGLAGCPTVEDPGFAGDDDDADDDDVVDDDDDTYIGDDWPAGAVAGPRKACDVPVAGFDRLEQQGSARGLTVPMRDVPPGPCVPIAGGVVAEDLDGDGDIDLLLQEPDGFPLAFANDGSGQFSQVAHSESITADYARPVYGVSAVDLNGDRLPEVILHGPGMVLAAANLGAMAFGPLAPLYLRPEAPYACIHGIAFGDIDLDGDLDLYIARADPLPDSETNFEVFPTAGSSDLLLLQDDGAFTEAATPTAATGPALSLLALMTDRDNDGDLDVLVPTDRAAVPEIGVMAFYRNDGGGQLSDDAPDVGASLNVSGMGIASNDLNADGVMDYCISDTDPQLRCLLSDATSGTWIEAGQALGLSTQPSHTSESPGGGWSWNAWSVELVDLDNDGWLDLPAAAGTAAPPNSGESDALWQGRPGVGAGFEDRAIEVGFNLPEHHYGMAAADFDADGYRDLIIGTSDGLPVFWSNPCGEDAWLEIELVGPAANSFALGARVTTRWGDDRADVQEVHAGRAMGQSPSAVHVGLGDVDEVDEVEVRWADGVSTRVPLVPSRRVLTIVHPDSGLEPPGR